MNLGLCPWKKREMGNSQKGWDTSHPCPGLPLAGGPGCPHQPQHRSLRCLVPEARCWGGGCPFPGLQTTQDHPAVQLLDPTALTDRQTLLARQPPWVQRRALPAGPSRPRCLNPGWPETPGALVPTPGRTPRGSCRLGAPVRAPGDPGEGGGVQGGMDRKGRLPSGEARTWAGGGCPGSGLHGEATVPSSIRDTVRGAEERASRGKPQARGHPSGRLTGAACPRG